jgi:hypothetical protein
MKKLTVTILAAFVLFAFTAGASDTVTRSFHKASKAGTETLIVRYKEKTTSGKWVNKSMSVSCPVAKDTEKDDKATAIKSEIKKAIRKMAKRPFGATGTGNSVTLTATDGFTLTKITSTNNTGQVGNESTCSLPENCGMLVSFELDGYASGYTADGAPSVAHIGIAGGPEAMVFCHGLNPIDILTALKFKLIAQGVPARIIGDKALYFETPGPCIIRHGCNDNAMNSSTSCLDLRHYKEPLDVRAALEIDN